MLYPDWGDGADWIKAGAWDIWGRHGLIDNVADLREHIAKSQSTVEHFKQLVVYRAHVDDPVSYRLREF